MATVDKLLVKLVADSRDYRRALLEAETAAERWKAATLLSAQAVTRAVNRYGGVALAGASVATSVFIKRSIDAADRVGKLSTRLGASTEALSEYQHVAEISGVTFETLTMGWQRMTRRVAEAAQGTGEAKDALKELGVEATSLTQMRPEEQFEVLADALNGVKGSADRVRLAMKLFDSEGVSLLQTMEGGSEALRNMRTEARELGLTIDQEAAIAAANFNDNLTRVNASARGLGLTLGNDLLPHLDSVTSAMAEAAKEGGPLEALWVGLGGVMAELVGADGSVTATKDALAENREELNNATEAVEHYKRALAEMAENQAAPAAVAHITNLLAQEEARVKQLTAAVEQAQTQLSAGAGPDTSAATPAMPSAGAPPADDAAQKERERLERKFEVLRQGWMTEQELILAQAAEREELINELEANAIGTQEQRDTLRLENAMQVERELTAIVDEEARKRADIEEQQAQRGQQAFERYLSAAASGNKTFFEIQKAYRLSRIALETPGVIADAFAWGTSIGGPYAGAAAAAVAGAAMGAYAQQIASASYGGTGGGGTSSAATVGAAPLPSANDTATPPTEDELSPEPVQEVSIVVSGGLHSDEDMRNLVARMEEVREDMGGNARFVAA